MTLVLASASPRRRQLLSTAGLRFEVRPSGVDEAVREGEAPPALVARLAGLKAVSVSREVPGAFVLGADTTVDVDGEILEKPRDDDEALSMLARLVGRWHQVHSGVGLARDGALLEGFCVSSRVHFREVDRSTLRRYVASGEPRDKAGAYAIQGLGSGLVDRMEGSYTSVVGMPVVETLEVLERHGALARWPS